ncbi:MAG TPA: hypothetical protein PLN21_19335 [Gemmatales bacterium]|nr:hypothetical protein [Gemmatales bacterium]
MKKCRLTIWRWLLALLLGTGTWWGVEWWLYPKPYLHIQRSIFPDVSPDQQSKKSDEPQIEVPGECNFIRFQASILDTAGKYLYIEETFAPGPRHYEVIDLQTKQTVARHAFAENKDAWPDLDDDRISLASPNGIKHIIGEGPTPTPDFVPKKKAIQNGNITFAILEDGAVIIGHPAIALQLWEWNVLKNETKVLRKFSQETVIKMCYDGSAVLEIERVTPLFPRLLLPGSLPNVLSGLIEKQLHCNDLAVMRVWSLPQLVLKSTMVLPWMDRQANAELSSDGNYLIVPDAETAHGFTSGTKVKSEGELHMYRHTGPGNPFGGSFFGREGYASTPLQIRVYDTNTGQLWWNHRDGAAIYFRHEDHNTGLTRFIPEIDQEKQYREILLHLSSKQSFQSFATNSMARLSLDQILFTEINLEEDVVHEIHAIDANGRQHRLAISHDESPKLIPNTQQYLIRRENSQSWIHNLADWLHQRQWFTNWHPATVFNIKVVDYANSRTLWRFNSSNHPEITITGLWLILTEVDQGKFEIFLYALPFPSWSPFWSIATGFVVLLIALYFLRQRRLQQG